MADETVIITSPGLVTWGSGIFGDGSYGGQELSLGILQGTATTSIDVAVSVTGTQLASAIDAVAIRIDQEPQVQGTQINLIVSSVVASIPETVTVTGSQINLDEGSVTTDFQPDAGWGVAGFGDVPWGEGPDVTVIVNEGSLTAIEGFTFAIQIDGNIAINVQDEHNLLIFEPTGTTTAADANAGVTGTQINLTAGSVAIAGNANVDVTGSQRNIEISSVTTTAEASVDVTGTQINFLPVGQAIEVITADVFPTGTQINVAEGLAGAVITGDANVAVTGTQINLTVNQVGVSADGNISVVADENQINITIGNEDISADANVNVTGSRINLTPGEVTYAAGYDVTGSRINIAIGNETTSGNANVDVTGIRLNTSIGSANVTAWAEVQTGANNIWTPVDLAA
jgi:hypothetical protein